MLSHFFAESQDGVKTAGHVIGPLPDAYTVIDTETTGFNRAQDLIVEVGWAVVRDRQMQSCGNAALDWTKFGGVDQGWLREKLRKTKYHVENDKDGNPTGRNYRFTYDYLAANGGDPLAGLAEYHGLLDECMRRGELIVAHNGWFFDREMLDNNFRRWLQVRDLPWGVNSVFDTGLVEKASQMGNRGVPWPTDNLTAYYQRLRQPRAIKWALDVHCVPKYGIAERYGLDMSQAHTSAFDCVITHYLFEHWRYALEHLRGLPSGQA